MTDFSIYGTECSEMYDLYSSPNIRMIKWGRMRWAGTLHVLGEERCIKDFGAET
jgi:hypothetical protein